MNLVKSILLLGILMSVNAYTQSEIKIPNIFTPNGDGVNDIFQIRAEGYQQLECTILNRYGHPVYKYFGVNGSWDGYTHAGVKVSAGTYYVYLSLVNTSGEVENRQGTVQVQF
jgi:gliding motility-associated-like protein